MPRRRFSVEDGYIPRDVIHSALDHLVSAKLLFQSGPRHYDSAGYLAHLGFELALKAALLVTSGSFPDLHRLGALLDELAAAELQLDLNERQQAVVRGLDQYFGLRYPQVQEGGIEVGNEDWDEIEELFHHLAAQMPEVWRLSVAIVDPTRKGGRELMSRPKNPPLPVNDLSEQSGS
jgi:HEPN domain-containing protein